MVSARHQVDNAAVVFRALEKFPHVREWTVHTTVDISTPR